MGAGSEVPTGGGAHLDLIERSDAELLAASRTGDPDAYGELFRRHVGAATALARRLTGHPADADDLVSEAFTKVLAALKNGNGPTSALRPYLLTAVRRVHVDRAKAAQRVQPTDDIGAHDPGVPFVDSALIGLERSMVAQAYRQLPERWQMVLWHTEVEELSPKDIAPLLGMSPNAVAALALRARAGLREAYLAAHVTTINSPECERMLPKLAAYARRSATAREVAAVERHLPDCPDCRAVLAELTDVGGRMRAVIAPLILGVAATGYLADIAAVPAIAAPPAVAAAGAGAAGAGTPGVGAVGGAGVPPPPGGSAAAAGSSTGGGGGAGGTAAGGQLAGWLVGAAATVIVAGAVAGAVVLSQNNAQQASGNGSSGSAGAGVSAPANPGPQPMPSAPGMGPTMAPGSSSSPTTPLGNRFSPSATSPTSVPTLSPTTASPTTPERPSSTPTVTPTTSPTSPTTPPPPSPTTTQSPTSSTPPPPPPPPPSAPEPDVAVVGELIANPLGSGSLTVTVPRYDAAALDVTIQLPSGITPDLALLPNCSTATAVPTGVSVICTGAQGRTLTIPVNVPDAGEYPLTTRVTGPAGSNIKPAEVTSSITVRPRLAPTATVTVLNDLVATPAGSSGNITVDVPADPAAVVVSIETSAPMEIALPLPLGCIPVTAQQATCLDLPVGPQSLTFAVRATDPGPYTVTATVAGVSVVNVRSTTTGPVPLTVVERATRLPAFTTTDQVTPFTIGNTFKTPNNQAGPSSATLEAGSGIRHARLYWAGEATNGPSPSTMSLTDPAGRVHQITAQASELLPTSRASFISAADVTQLVRAGVTPGRPSTWTGGPTGAFEHGATPFAGWVLVVVAESVTQPTTQLTVSDNNQVLSGLYNTDGPAGATSVGLVTWGGQRGSLLTIHFGSYVGVHDESGSGLGENMDLIEFTSSVPGERLTIASVNLQRDRLVFGAMITQRPVG